MRKIICIGLLVVMAFSLTACVEKIPDDLAVAAAKDAMTLVTETSEDLVLPPGLEGYEGVAITWASSNEAVISSAGVVVRQKEDTEVTLTATLTKGMITEAKRFKVTVFFDLDLLLREYDLTEEKNNWDMVLHGKAIEGEVLVTFRKTNTYPILKPYHFRLSNIKSIQYGLSSPMGNFGVEYIEGFHQHALIELYEPEIEKVIEAIIHIETLEFVLSARPNTTVASTEW